MTLKEAIKETIIKEKQREKIVSIVLRRVSLRG